MKVVLIYIMLCLIWGSTWLAIRLGLESLTPLFSAGIRFILASSIIILLMKLKDIKIQKDPLSVKLYLLMAFCSFVIPFGLVYWGQQYVPSGLAAVLFAVYPFFVALFSYYAIPSETINASKIFGIIFGFAGVVIIFSDNLVTGDFSLNFAGMGAIVLSAVMQSVIAVSIKKYGHHLNPLSMNLVPMLIAGISLSIIGFLFEDLSRLKFDSNAVLSVTYLAIFGSVITFTSYYWLLKRVNIVILSLIAFITPIVALILGWIFVNEKLLSHHLYGSLLVLTGLLWANLGNIKKIRNLKILKNQK